jgi:hypothetical protein
MTNTLTAAGAQMLQTGLQTVEDLKAERRATIARLDEGIHDVLDRLNRAFGDTAEYVNPDTGAKTTFRITKVRRTKHKVVLDAVREQADPKMKKFIDKGRAANTQVSERKTITGTKGKTKGKRGKPAAVSPKRADAIRDDFYKTGDSHKALSARWGVSAPTIQRIIARKGAYKG